MICPAIRDGEDGAALSGLRGHADWWWRLARDVLIAWLAARIVVGGDYVMRCEFAARRHFA